MVCGRLKGALVCGEALPVPTPVALTWMGLGAGVTGKKYEGKAAEVMIAVVKVSTQDQVKLRYQAEVIERQPHVMIVSSAWTGPARDLGCTRFEPGDRFTEYYYPDRSFDIQEVVNGAGLRKGWYCDIAEPAVIEQEQIRLVDLELDVWVSVQGTPVILDEEEFEARPLSEAQRTAAREGLQALLTLLEAREGPFAVL